MNYFSNIFWNCFIMSFYWSSSNYWNSLSSIWQAFLKRFWKECSAY